MLFLGIWSSIKLAMKSLLLTLCKPVYMLIVRIYDLFITVGTASIITNDTINILYKRVGLLLGIYMAFRVMFSFVQLLINPDLVSDKEKGVGNILKKVILVVALLGIMPALFQKAMELQNLIVGASGENTNIIQRLILPDIRTYTYNDEEIDFGASLSAYIFTSFYRYDERMANLPLSEFNCNIIHPNGNVPDPTEDYDITQTRLYQYIAINSGDLDLAEICLDEDYTFKITFENEERTGLGKIAFGKYGVMALIVGIFILWILISYTLTVGIRMVQLAFLRMISPLAIMSYLSPKKDTTFEKWGKMFITTYIDLFIRMAIIYFIVYLIQIIISSNEILITNQNFNQTPINLLLFRIVLILSLLSFAKKAPELLKELFPKSGAASLGFGIKSPKALAKELGELPGAGLVKSAAKRTKNFAGHTAGFIDAKRHGVGTKEALKDSYFPRFGKFRKEHMPYAQKEYENKIEGAAANRLQNRNYKAGVKGVKRLIEENGVGFDWTKALDGKNKKNYETLYGKSASPEFIQTKMDMDKEKKRRETLQFIQQDISSGTSLDEALKNANLKDASGIAVANNGYFSEAEINSLNSNNDVFAAYQKSSDTETAIKEIHENNRKQNPAAAIIEDQFKLVKNNEINRANSKEGWNSFGIRP